MAGKDNTQSIIKKAWEDTWKWLRKTKIGWVVPVLVGGIVGGLLAGVIGAFVVIGLTVGIVFIFHLVITPSRLNKEERHKFIRDNASYFSMIFGNKEKRNYLTILDILKSMIKIENEVTSNLSGKYNITIKEWQLLQKRLNKKTRIPTLPQDKALKLYLKGDVTKTIDNTISKLGLGFVGDNPSEKQIEFFVRIREFLDDAGIGLANELAKVEEYTKLLNKFNELIPDMYDDSVPDWILYLLIYPSSFNSFYIWYGAMPFEYKKIYFRNGTPKVISEFKEQRETSIKCLVDYAESSIENI
ncbi:hypothetical protein ACFLWU_02385 [Chloroflexota bacterium]